MLGKTPAKTPASRSGRNLRRNRGGPTGVARGETEEGRPELLGETLGKVRPELLGEKPGRIAWEDGGRREAVA